MNELLDLHPGHWILLILPHSHWNRLLIAAAYLAQRGPLTVLDCGRRFDASIVARAARGQAEVIDRIQIQRAFICYEAVKLLERTPAGRTPTLVLDFLSTFYDENVRMDARTFLLESSLRHFQRLSHTAGLVVSTNSPPASPEALYLFERLQSAASQTLIYESPVAASSQLDLF
jgi:hypothetical protein